jgi:hypothetical protein
MTFAAWPLMKSACEMEYSTSLNSGLLEFRRLVSIKDFFNPTNKTPPPGLAEAGVRSGVGEKTATKI